MDNQFNAGDLVWAKLRSHPWWPGIIYHECLTSTEVQQGKKEGFVLVSFFGDNSYKWLDPKTLLHFESNYNVYLNRSRSRLYVKAVNEAVYEINHRAALGLTCPCQFFSSYRPAPVEGLLEVDIDGYQSGGVYTMQQIDRLKHEFQPVETLSFVQLLALDFTNRPQDLSHSTEVARVLTFRKAKYAEVDEPYFLAFGVDPTRLGDPLVASNNEETAVIQAPIGHPIESENQGQKKPTAKRQRATKTEHTVKRDQCYDSKSKSCLDHVPRKKSRAKVKLEKRLAITSAGDDKKGTSPSLFKEPSMSVDGKSVESSATATKSGDVCFVEKVRSSDASVSSDTEKVQTSGTPVPSKTKKVQYSDPFMPSKTKEVQFTESSMPSKTCCTRKDSPPASNPSKKRQQSVSPTEGCKMLLALSPPKKREKGENITMVKAPERGSKRILSMKFPTDAALPSAAELKARFVRFGPIDASSTHVSYVKSKCWVVFMNKSDAMEAYTHVVKSEMFGQTNITYRLLGEVTTESNLLEGGISGANTGSNLQQEETPVTPPHAPVFSCSTYVYRIERRYQEIYAKYQEQKDQTNVQANQGGPDISKEFLYLLNKCGRIVLGSEAL